jgi:FAD/FMN-containing dehydrogenase
VSGGVAAPLRIADQLGAGFKGDAIGPDHPEYGDRRQVWNAMVDKHPGVILRCTSTEDVVAAVNVARVNGLPPSIRCGGHSVSGKALSDGGLTIDLSGMREVTVDAVQGLVHAGGGCLLGDLDNATAPHGLIVPAGIMSETGVGGLALGGGIGWFSRKHGLTCDQFVSLELVLASGGSSTSPRPSTPSCSGPSRAAAATSGWSHGSPSGHTGSAR